MRYRSRPVEVEAMQWQINTDMRGESGSQLSARRIVEWVNANGGEARYEADYVFHGQCIIVRAKQGETFAYPGHYIVMGELFHPADGKHLAEDPDDMNCGHWFRDFYPCDPETFEKRWEPIG